MIYTPECFYKPCKLAMFDNKWQPLTLSLIQGMVTTIREKERKKTGNKKTHLSLPLINFQQNPFNIFITVLLHLPNTFSLFLFSPFLSLLLLHFSFLQQIFFNKSTLIFTFF